MDKFPAGRRYGISTAYGESTASLQAGAQPVAKPISQGSH